MSCCRRRRRRTRSEGSCREYCDVTLEDFANSSVSFGHARLKKPMRNVLREVKSLTEATGSKTYDATAEHSEENADMNQEVPVRPTRRRRKTPTERNTSTGVRYPVDLWFLISDYIEPECVGKFARLCKDSLHVVQTAQFWLSLYRRYYKPGTPLPEKLQPESMVQRYGLRARVIRALYYMHRPFTLRCASATLSKSTVLNRKVVRQWYQINLGSGYWTYYLKLQDINHTSKPISSNLVEVLDDIMINREEGCVTMMIECSQFVHLPLLMGMVLRDISVVLGTALLGSQAHLQFTYSVANTGPAVCVDVVYIVSLNFIHWWNPCYPHAKHPLPCITIADCK
ncbi:transmembrane protein 183-like [Schistocerca cancellata]|uniref:transmembrane protein 183-like n=1 Tax=Schistocerca cancellata TaxID=274614 RepID=UPI0021183AC2|nr:transmembrane protein 183-like [Schistocerca cancellata]